jgi:hypothetical protein
MAKTSKRRKPRKLSLVKFNFDGCPVEYHKKCPFSSEVVYVYLGDIVNMPGHCVVVEHETGRIYSGFHTENFVEIPEDEC